MSKGRYFRGHPRKTRKDALFPSGRAVADGPTDVNGQNSNTWRSYCPSVRPSVRPSVLTTCCVRSILLSFVCRPRHPERQQRRRRQFQSHRILGWLLQQLKSKAAVQVPQARRTDMDARTEGRRWHRQQEGEGHARVEPVAELPLGHGSRAAAPAAAAA